MTKKILLVDDSSYMRGVLKKILREAGYDAFVEAGDGDAAIRAYAQEQPDLVLMDIVMPNKNGIDALRAIRQADERARVVMVSAVGQEVIMREALAAGAVGFIVKPFEASRVTETIQRVMDGKAA